MINIKSGGCTYGQSSKSDTAGVNDRSYCNNYRDNIARYIYWRENISIGSLVASDRHCVMKEKYYSTSSS